MAASLVSPLGFLAANRSRSPDLTKVVLMAGVLFILGLGLAFLVRQLARHDQARGTDVAASVVVFSSFGILKYELPGVSGWTFLIVGVLVALLVLLLVSAGARRLAWLAVGVRWMILIMALTPLLLMVGQGSTARASAADRQTVVLILVDGYVAPSLMTGWDVPMRPTLADLIEPEGFEVREVRSSYSMTYASFASALEGRYLVGEGTKVDAALRSRLYSILQGDNQFVRRFQEAGYDYLHVESGWTGTRCGERVDLCVAAPFLEETLWNLVQRTALAVLFEEWFGHAFSLGGRATLEWLESQFATSSTPTLVVAHVLLPHPPLYLNESCQVEYSRLGTGQNVWAAYMGESVRQPRLEMFAQQQHCVDLSIQQIVSNRALDDAVIALVGDHGSDSLGQLWIPVDAWTEPMIEERMTTIGAIRGCEEPMPGQVINVPLHLLDCALGHSSLPLPLEQYLVPVEEIQSDAKVIRIGQH